MYKVFVKFRGKGKKYYYIGNDLRKVFREQDRLWKEFRKHNEVESIGFEC